MRAPFPPSPSPAPGATRGPAGTERLTAGRATVLLAPVRDDDHLAALVAPIRRVRGLVSVAVERFQDGEAVVAVVAGHPVLLGDQLRRVLDGLVRSCSAPAAGGHFVVDAREPETVVEEAPDEVLGAGEDEEEVSPAPEVGAGDAAAGPDDGGPAPA
ncbi:hypothetical protein AB0L40_27745, partial [Patulibacter sp. NPDC049589]